MVSAMPKRSASIFAALIVALALCPTNLFAQCVEQPRKVTLDRKHVVPLKSYLCTVGTGGDAAQFRVEYFRLSDFAVSLMLANASSAKLQATIGAAKLLTNDVSRTYADLIKQFGVTGEVTADSERGVTRFNLHPPTGAEAAADGSNAQGDDASTDSEDKVRVKKLRTLLGFYGQKAIPYPANDEIAALRKKIIPANLNYYYEVSEAPTDGDPATCDKEDIACIQDGRNTATMRFWRPLTIADIDNFAANAKAYNAQLLQARKNKATARDDYVTADQMGQLKLAKFMANGSLPDDFLLMTSLYSVAACGIEHDLPGLAGWSFDIEPRDVAVEAVRIENISRRSISLAGFFGEKHTDAGLRAMPSRPGPPDNAALLDTTATTLAPGQSVLELTNITFTTGKQTQYAFDTFREKMETLQHLGANGFSGNVAGYRASEPKDYTFGPVLTVTGAQVNGARVDFVERPLANFIEMSLTAEAGSCPYLLSWDETDHEWITHGKVLHKGQGKSRAYTETVTFPSLRSRFRIEEREPELAHLQGATLVVELHDGTTQAFLPIRAAANAPDDGDIILMWGEAVDLSFAIPDTLNAADVRQTRLQVTGYYERYTDLLGAQARSAPATPVSMRANTTAGPATAPRGHQ
jgi:hypothetical protein